MPVLALRFGALSLDRYEILRSALRWALPDGANCGSGQVLAYCNIGLRRKDAAAPDPFAGEARDLQVALLATAPGILRQRPELSPGGFQDYLTHVPWRDEPFATLECSDRGAVDSEPAQLVLVAGRRVAESAEVRSGLLTGWHDRVRAGTIGEGPPGTLLAAGICDLEGALRGPSRAFVEFVQGAGGPAQVICLSDACMVPAAPVLREQLERTAGDLHAIAADMAQGLLSAGKPPDPADLVFAAGVLGYLGRSPFTEPVTTLSRAGLARSDGPDAVLLSVRSEDAVLLRHRRLGYTLAFHRYRLDDAGHGFREWLRSSFEFVRRSPQQVKADYATFLDVLRVVRPAMKVLVCNALSTLGLDDLQTYAGQAEPMEASLRAFRLRSRNLMLLELAESHGIAVVDTDAIAAEMGAMLHLHDGLHGDGAFDAAVRCEVLATTAVLGVRGFRPR